MMDFPLLSILILLPIIGGGLLLFCKQNHVLARQLALVISVATMLLSFLLYIGFDTTSHQMQFVERLSWIATFNIEYYLGIDGFSMPLMILTTISTVLVVIAGWQVNQDRAA